MLSEILLYVDPGSGSYLIQVIIAAILGALFYFKRGWQWIKALFWRPKKEDVNENDNVNG